MTVLPCARLVPGLTSGVRAAGAALRRRVGALAIRVGGASGRRGAGRGRCAGGGRRCRLQVRYNLRLRQAARRGVGGRHAGCFLVRLGVALEAQRTGVGSGLGLGEALPRLRLPARVVHRHHDRRRLAGVLGGVVGVDSDGVGPVRYPGAIPGKLVGRVVGAEEHPVVQEEDDKADARVVEHIGNELHHPGDHGAVGGGFEGDGRRLRVRAILTGIDVDGDGHVARLAFSIDGDCGDRTPAARLWYPKGKCAPCGAGGLSFTCCASALSIYNPDPSRSRPRRCGR